MNTGNLTLSGFGGWKRLCAVLLFCFAAALALQAQSFKTLASFNTGNGFGPTGPLVQGFDGSLYGTTEGGNFGIVYGNVFRVTREGALTSIYTFCPAGNCTDGAYPSGLVLAADGNFYGTTSSGGSSCDSSLGTIFKITPLGELTTLHSFQGTDGSGPSGLVQASDGNFYGTTYYGGSGSTGCNGGDGTIFRITPEGEFTSLYSFCLKSACADGRSPEASLIQGGDGNLYGHTSSGGADGVGTLFRSTLAGSLTTFHSFDDTEGSPGTALVETANGDFYGATSNAGNPNYGAFFGITDAGDLTTLYSFCSQTNCADGYFTSGFVQGTDGNFYGANAAGGFYPEGCGTGCGTLFEITPTGTLTTLHTFCEGECLDGAIPEGGLLQATDGKFYGTTFLGVGTIFRLSTGLGPFVKLQRDVGIVGDCVNLLGQGFEGATGVFLNGIAMTFTVDSDTHIGAHVPAGATSGYVTVATPGGTLTSNVIFRVKP